MSGRTLERTLLRTVAHGFPLLVCVLLMAGCPLFPPADNNDPNDQNEPNDTNVVTGNTGLTGKYIGSQTCATCHRSMHTDWSGTLHAGALETLEAIGQGSNAACLPCHVVGYGESGGFVSRATTNALAGVGCEACHDGARDHVQNVSDLTKLPTISIKSEVCGVCHTDDHHPTYDDWAESGHGTGDYAAEVYEEIAAGTNFTSCGACHSGDYFYLGRLGGASTYTAGGYPGHPATIGNNYKQGTPAEDLARITCAVCHDPHQKTGKASNPDEGRDFQLRFDEVKAVTATNTIAATNDPTRFNLCGQCHHARDRTWLQTGATSREPHPSAQSNFFFGEMPLPVASPDPIVVSRVSFHVSAENQCVTCHVYRAPIQEGIAPAVSGHTFEVSFNGCVGSGCHTSATGAENLYNGLKAEVEGRLAHLEASLDAWAAAASSSWQYTASGGTANQATLPSGIQKARFLLAFVEGSSGEGVHNPGYMRDCLEAAEAYVAAEMP
jgi:hypothetical protein